MSKNKEWSFVSNEPELLNLFGGWGDRSKKQMTEQHLTTKPLNMEPPTLDVGKIFLDEIKKFHNIENGFNIEKIRDLIINVVGVNLNCQVFVVNTPWNNLKTFTFFSPISQEGFQKFASIIRGNLELGKRGTPDNPQPYWEWNTLTVDGLENVETMGPPVLVEYNGKQYFDYLVNFFFKTKNPMFVKH
jgi:hypothetical protein